MTLLRLEVCNFGSYLDAHSILLQPAEGKNIVLIGGLNGSGKTTLLNAIRIVLFGKLVSRIFPENQSYELILRNYISRGREESETYVELEYDRTGDGEIYRLHRSWKIKSGKVIEAFSIKEFLRQGEQLTFKQDCVVQSQNWYSVIDQVFPPYLSNLFFFDGERIEELADQANSSRILENSLELLFGGGVIRQLLKDLSSVESQVLKQLAPNDVSEAFHECLTRLEYKEKELENINALQHEIQISIAKLESENENLQESLRAVGGERISHREELNEKRKALQTDLKTLELNSTKLISGIFPFILQIQNIKNIASCPSRLLSNEGTDYITSQLSLFKVQLSEKLNAKTNIDCKDIFNDSFSYFEKKILDISIGVDPRAELEAKGILSSESEILVEANNQIKEYHLILRNITEIDAEISKIPPFEAVEPIINQLDECNILLKERRERLSESIKSQSDIKKEIDKLRNEAELYAIKIGQDKKELSESSRVVERISVASELLNKFHSKILEQRLNTIRFRTLEYYNRLHRKVGYIKEILIDPETFRIKVLDSHNREIEIAMLSAGERQLLAMSLLWAIAKDSNSDLPFIIDTPLGRLDSKHREKMLLEFFPEASHQVILLTTDQEISSFEYQKILKNLTHEYTLVFDDDSKSSHIEHGYNIGRNLI